MNLLYEIATGQKANNYYESDGQIYRKDYEDFNGIVNVSDKSIELMVYAKGFKVSKSIAMCEEYCSSMYNDYEFVTAISTQKWTSIDGVANPLSAHARLSELIASRAKGARASLNKFYNYALGDNNWQYFCTWTFADGKTRNDKDLLYDTYNRFICRIRRDNTDMIALASYEEFEKGGYHMHALLGNCVLNLSPSIHPDTKQFMYSQVGQSQLFNCLEWKYGWSTVVCIRPDSVKEQVVNYLSKYITKATPAPYKCKRFFRTDNLSCRDTYIFRSSNFAKIIADYGLIKVKSIREGEVEIYRASVTEVNCREMISNNKRISGGKR